MLIINADGTPLDPAAVAKLTAKLSALQSTAGSVLSNATIAKKLLAQMTATTATEEKPNG